MRHLSIAIAVAVLGGCVVESAPTSKPRTFKGSFSVEKHSDVVGTLCEYHFSSTFQGEATCVISDDWMSPNCQATGTGTFSYSERIPDETRTYTLNPGAPVMHVGFEAYTSEGQFQGSVGATFNTHYEGVDGSTPYSGDQEYGVLGDVPLTPFDPDHPAFKYDATTTFTATSAAVCDGETGSGSVHVTLDLREQP